MKDFFRQNGVVLMVIAVLLAVLLSIGSVLLGGSEPLRNFANTITSPVRNAVSGALSWAEGVYGYVFHYDEMENELAELRKQVADLEEELRQSKDASDENERLRALLNLQGKRRDFVFESARVATRSTSNWESTLTIGKGSGAGIEIGDCVVTETGELVGVVTEVSHATSVVSTIINTDFQMGGIVPRTYSGGVLEGDFSLMNEGKLKFNYLSDDAQLVAGDEIVTSGLGEIYPSGLVVGRVESVFTSPSGMERYAVVIPSVRTHDITQVFVIKEFTVID